MLRKILKNLTALLLTLALTFVQILPLTNPVYAATTSPWTQTDWSGGSGQTSWSDNTKFSSGSSVTTSTVGQATLTSTEKLSNTGFESNLTSWQTGIAPNSVSGLQLWVDADLSNKWQDSARTTAATADNDPIGAWDDLSGNSNHMTQSTGGNRPILDLAAQNGLPAVQGDGTQWLEKSAILLSGTQATIITAYQTTDAATTGQILFYTGFGGSNGWGLSNVSTLNKIGMLTGGVIWDNGTVTADTNSHIVSLVRDTSSFSLFVDGSAAGAFTRTPNSPTTITRIMSDGANQRARARVFSVLAYNTVLSSSERQNIQAYLQGKYAISADNATLTRDTTTTYSSSSGSAKLVTGSNATSFNQYVNVGDTNTYNLSAYAYTNGSAVISSDVELFYNGSTVSTTYTSVGGGWYQLTGTVTGANASRQYGVQVKANKTVYVDNFSLNNYASSGTLTSSIFDSEFTAGSFWGDLTYNATTPSNTSVSVKVRTSDSSTMSGAADFSACTAISSGSDISTNSCVTDGDRYVQYQLALANTDLVSTPTFQDISIAFETYDSTGPVLDLDSPGGNSYTNSERPTFRWKEATDVVSSISDYDLIIDNPTLGTGQPSGDFTIGDIPVSRTTDYETSKYKVVYENFSDSDSTNNYISVFTKSSSSWSTDSNSGENDGKLREGKVNWKVKVTDSVGNITESSRTLFVDRTNPNTEVTQVNSVSFSSSGISTTDKTPTIFGKVTDPLAGFLDSGQSQDDHGPKISSGPKSVEIKIEKKEGITYKPHTIYTVNMDKPWYTCDGKEVSDNTKQRCDKYLPFEFTPKDNLELGTYKITLTGKDKADNSSSTSFELNITTLSEITTPEEKEIIEKEVQKLPEEEREEVKQDLEITKPTDQLPPPSALKKTGENIAETTKNILQGTGNLISTVFTGIGNGIGFVFHSVGSGLSFIFNKTGQGLAFVGNGLGTGLNSVGKAIGTVYTNLANSAPGAVRSTLIAIGNGTNATGSAISAAANNIGQGINNATAATKEGIANVAFTVGESAQNVSEKAGFVIVKFGYNFVNEPTTISDVQVVVLSPTSAKVTWYTNHPANGKVNYGFGSGDYKFEQQTDKRTTHHEFILTDLSPDTAYHYEVMSHNKNYVYDANRKFSTPSN